MHEHPPRGGASPQRRPTPKHKPANKSERQWLEETGQFLYGYGWVEAMARDLMVSLPTVKRWIAGKAHLPGPAKAALNCFVNARRLAAARAELLKQRSPL